MRKEAYPELEYGKYERLYADKRTAKILEEIDRVADKLKVKYALIGGLAAYIRVKNPPQDFPDIDIQLYCGGKKGWKFLEEIAKRPKFEVGQSGREGDAVFGMFMYDDWVQVDIFTDIEQMEPTETERIEGVEVEPVEYLVIEKLFRGKDYDIRSVLDLLAYTDYNKRLLMQLARERHLTGAVNHLQYFARLMATGKLSDEGIDNIVKRLNQG